MEICDGARQCGDGDVDGDMLCGVWDDDVRVTHYVMC